MSKSSVRAASAKGQVPTIVCINRATSSLEVPFGKLVSAMQSYVDNHVAPVWGTPAKLMSGTDFLKGAWAIEFLDNADHFLGGQTEAYHLTPHGLPLAKVFVVNTILHGDFVSVAASHELVEMLVDPAINLMTTGTKSRGLGTARTMYAYEVVDPVQKLSFNVHGIPMSNFVYPSYFEAFHQPGSTQFDHMKKVKRPFQILPGGNQFIFKGGKRGKWSVLQFRTKEKPFRREDHRGHRSETRITGGARRPTQKRAVRGG